MRNSWVRAAVVGLIAGAVFVACDDNPVDEDRDRATRLQVNPTYATLDAADTLPLSASASNPYGDATLDAVTFTLCQSPTITFETDESRVTLQPPDRILVIGETLGESCVVASSAGLTDTAVVDVVPASLAVTAAPDTLRAGLSDEVVVEARDAAGVAVGPYVRSDVTYETSASAVAELTDDIGSVTTSLAGQADITATWEGGGISRSVSHTIVVIPNVPTGAAFASALFDAVGAGTTAEMEVVVSDAEGNQNTSEDEITGVTAVSSDENVATVTAELVPSMSVNVIVTVTGQGAGTADITGTVTTTVGDFAFGPAIATVLDPIATGVTPPSGAPGIAASINGTGLAAAGFDTEVTVDDLTLGDVDVVSATQVDALMPTFGAAGDYDVVVSVGGVAGSPVTWTQVGVFDEAASEPNDDPDQGQESSTTVPFEFDGTFADGDIDDFFRFTVSREVTLVIDLDWNNDKDLDILVTDGAFTAFVCTDGATGAKPEQSVCHLPAAGEYLLWLEDFDAALGDLSPVTYTVTGAIE